MSSYHGAISDSRWVSAPAAEQELQFCETVPSDYQCSICHGVAREAVVTEECGHLFCRACIRSALQRKPECPVDRSPLKMDQVRKDVRTQRKVSALSVFCTQRKGGCPWQGALGDLGDHTQKCEFAPMKCPFASHGCDVTAPRKAMSEHLQGSIAPHLLYLCNAISSLQEDNLALEQEMDIAIARREDRFIWVIPEFESKSGPVYSRKFAGKGLLWYLGVDFEGPDQHTGVYLFAEGHQRRVDFKLILFNLDPHKDKVHTVNDWAIDFKGKGWGPLKFINRLNLESTGFLVNNCIRIGVELDSEAFE